MLPRLSLLLVLGALFAPPVAAGPLVSAELRLALQGFAPITIPAASGAGAGGVFSGTITSATVRGPFSFSAGSAFAGTRALSATSAMPPPTALGFPFGLRIRLGTASLLTGYALFDILNLGGGFMGSMTWTHPLVPDVQVPLPLGRPVALTRSSVSATASGGPWGLVPVLLGTALVTPPPSIFASSNPTPGGGVTISRVTPVSLSVDLPQVVGRDQRLLFAQLRLAYGVPEPTTTVLLLLAGVAWLGVSRQER